jgi:lactate dehydrogenase-like 2-hydroxyacid dehydrogenase
MDNVVLQHQASATVETRRAIADLVLANPLPHDKSGRPRQERLALAGSDGMVNRVAPQS